MNMRKGNPKIVFKLTNGQTMSVDKQQWEEEKLTFKKLFQLMNEQVPFEYILINQVDNHQSISKMNHTFEYEKTYELYDARGLLKFYVEKRELKPKYSDQIKLKNENDSLKSETFILSEQIKGLQSKLVKDIFLQQLEVSRFKSQEQGTRQSEKDEIKNLYQTLEQQYKINSDLNKEIDQFKIQLQEKQNQLVQNKAIFDKEIQENKQKQNELKLQLSELDQLYQSTTNQRIDLEKNILTKNQRLEFLSLELSKSENQVLQCHQKINSFNTLLNDKEKCHNSAISDQAQNFEKQIQELNIKLQQQQNSLLGEQEMNLRLKNDKQMLEAKLQEFKNAILKEND